MKPNLDTLTRTQDERSAAMRTRLIEATLETILEDGYAQTTLVAIAKRAGVTRGALHHHYDSKDDLIVDAISRQLTDVSAEIREWAKLVQAGSLDLSDFLDRVWGLFSGKFFMVSLEQITASRHNEILRNRLAAVTRDFHRALDETWSGFFSKSAQANSQLETVLNATLCLFRGMGAQTVLRNDPAYYQALLDFWKDMLVNQIGIESKSAK